MEHRGVAHVYNHWSYMPPLWERQRLAEELEAARRKNNALNSQVSELERQRAGAGDSAALAGQLAAACGDLLSRPSNSA